MEHLGKTYASEKKVTVCVLYPVRVYLYSKV